MPTKGYVARAVRDIYKNFKDFKNTDPDFTNAVKNAKRWYEDLKNGKLDNTTGVEKKRCRVEGAGRKTKAPELRESLFAWFVDVRTALKARLPKRLFIQKAKQLYGDWLKDNPTPVEEQLKFSKHWIRDWEKEYGVSRRKPNKRYSISKEDCVIRVTDYLYNIWLVTRYFLVHFRRNQT